MGQTKVHVTAPSWDDLFQVWLSRETHGHGRQVASPPVFYSPAEGAAAPPTFALDMDTAQGVMNQLWSMGLRPRDGAGSLAHVDAMKDHLDDLRRIAFARKKVPVKAGPAR